MIWGYLPFALTTAAIAVGYALLVRHEARSGKAYILFWPVERWSRNRQPTLFQMRQVIGWIFVVFLAVVALTFLAEFLGLLHA